MRPKLSICIPTYNRASLLRFALQILSPQAAVLGDKIELVVSDNCSTDETKNVVSEFQSCCPIRYRCNDKNKGPLYNIVNTVTDFAQGEYCWTLGDDDVVYPGALKKVLSILEKHSDLDYIFVNHSYSQGSLRKNFVEAFDKECIPEAELLCFDTKEGLLSSFEDIVFLSNQMALFTSMVSHIFKKDLFVQESNRFSTLYPAEYLSMGELFPHVYLLLPRLVGRPVYYVGEPLVVLFIGAQNWHGYWPSFLFSYVLQISDYLRDLGVRDSVADRYQNVIFQNGEYFLRQVMFKPSPTYLCDLGVVKIKEQDKWSLCKGLKRYWKNRYFRRMLGLACWRELKERFSSLIK